MRALAYEPLMRLASSFILLGLALGGCGGGPPLARSDRAHDESSASRVVSQPFRFHARFWTNLHQVLIHESLLPREGMESPKSLKHRSVVDESAFGAGEAIAWHHATDDYGHRFTTRNSFDEDHVVAAQHLAALDESALPSDVLSQTWQTALRDAALPYRAHFWTDHERADREYIAKIRPLVDAHGALFVARLKAIYETPWPTEPVEVEVAPVVPPFGAMTLGEPPFTGRHRPLITVSSLDPGYSGESGLEMIFHEASHLLVDRVQTMLDASAKRQGRRLPPGLWHLLLFYTAGHVAQERLGRMYVPYAERPENHVFEGEFASILKVLIRDWQPYLDQRITLASAVDAVVANFGAEAPSSP